MDFIEYILAEVKSKRIMKADAVALLRQFQQCTVSGKNAYLHPLVHQNTSDLSQQRFSSRFTGQEFYLADHIVNGQSILPGVAYLEMARTAVLQATGVKAKNGISFKDISWMTPAVVGDEAVRIHVGIVPSGNDVTYEIYSQFEGEGDDSQAQHQVVHCQGTAILGDFGPAPVLNIDKLKKSCDQRSITSGQCYDMFRAMGIDYGPRQQGIEDIFIGANQVLARLSLPASITDPLDQYVLHPALMDSALQAIVGFMNPSDNTALLLPFALHELKIFGECTESMWARVTYSAGSNAYDQIKKFDVDLCDESGVIRVRMTGFSSRVLEGRRQGVDSLLTGNVMLSPVWDCVAVQYGNTFPAVQDKLTIIGGSSDIQDIMGKRFDNARILDIEAADSTETITAKLNQHGHIDHILWVMPQQSLPSLSDELVIESQNNGVLLCFRTIKALLSTGYGERDLAWTVITTQTQAIYNDEAINPCHASLHGLMGSTAKEYPNWKIRLLDLEADSGWPLDELFRLPSDAQGNALAYRNREWYQQRLIPCQLPTDQSTLYKQGGVYVVIGGAGGIGEAWSEVMIQDYQAQIIWIGRRPKDAAIQAKIDRLANRGPAPIYLAADATNRQSLQQACDDIKRRHRKINGVIHSAIVLLDKSLANMDEQRFQAGLAAKIDVSVRMAQVFAKESLDFVLFFSSMNAFIKSPGQSNYAAGCTFKDAFAHQLLHEWSCPVKVINWGYWGSVGIVASKEYQDRMVKAGVGSLEFPEVMAPLNKLLNGPVDRIALIKTTKPLVMDGLMTEERYQVYQRNTIPDIYTIQQQLAVNVARLDHGKLHQSLPGDEMNDVLFALFWGQLQLTGLFNEKSLKVAELTANSGVSDSYRRWLEESLRVLAEKNYIRYDGVMCSVIGAAPIDVAVSWNKWHQKKQTWLENPSHKAQVQLVEATLSALPAIIKGEQAATDIIFPDSSMALVEGIYKHNDIADYFNEVLADTVVTYIEKRLTQTPAAKVSILEIGAGTGGTSAMVFSKLKPLQAHIQEYCYSDISKAFLLHAEKEYSDQAPYLNYKIFNVEAAIAGQDIAADRYEIVIATNVLHATKNIRQTLRNAKAVLKKNGILIINELSSNTLFAHLTFGLLEGWWLYEDASLRIPGCPGLYPDVWREVLRSEGFHAVFFPAHEQHALGQQIIVAQSDGVVRQKLNDPTYLPAATTAANVTSGQTQAKAKAQAIPMQRLTGASAADGHGGHHSRDNVEDIRQKSIAYFKKLVGETLKIPINKIDASEPLEEYGIDSIIVVQLTNALREVMSDISSTIFFEFQTIDALVTHFIKTQNNALTTLIGYEEDDLSHPDAVDHSDADVTTSRAAPTITEIAKPGITAGRFRQPHAIESQRTVGPLARTQEMAVIGLSGRYPQAENVTELWKNLSTAKSCIVEIPADRWDWTLLYDEKIGKKGHIYTKWGGFINGIDKFDTLFFQISPAEAERMDPQERLFMEEAYASIEDAGYTPNSLSDSRNVGVFVGVMNGNYAGNSNYWSIANRVSYLLNFHGPSLAVDTACSSSLTAIHLALESINSGTCDIAIAGGVNLIVDPIHFLNLAEMKMLSSSDQCRSFGDQADGFVDSEGVGALVLKPLENAVAHGDHIYGVIKGSMVNSGGKTNGFTVPNPTAQYELIADALRRAHVDARTVSYIEAHGTGTALGDPIEIAGLTRAFENNTSDKQFCAIGSVKSNIGHCESAAGIAGITKLLLQLKHRQLVPSLHSSVTNPEIDFKNTPFIVQQALTDWKRPQVTINGEMKEYPRRAGISSFGAGGMNAHLILEEYDPLHQEQPQILITKKNPAIIVLSAKNKDRLKARIEQLLLVIEQQPLSNNSLPSLAYTLQVGRVAMDLRLAIIVSSMTDLVEKLKSYINNQMAIDGVYLGDVKHKSGATKLFSGDEELTEIIKQWLQRKKYTKLVELWVNGVNIDWAMLYGDVTPSRMSLPTYPFTKERYWISNSGAHSTANTASHRQEFNREISNPAAFGNAGQLVEEKLDADIRQPETAQSEIGQLMLRPCWKQQDLIGDENEDVKTPIYEQHIVIFCDIPADFVANIDAELSGVHCLNLHSTQQAIDYRFQHYAAQALEEIQSRLIDNAKGRVLIQIVVAAQGEQQLFAGLSGLVKTLQLENPRFSGQLITLDRLSLDSGASVAKKLSDNAKYPGHQHIRYRDGKRWLVSWQDVEATNKTVNHPWKPNGVYLITGGAGGLGLIVAKEIAHQTAAVTLILTGRSELNEYRESQLKELETLGATVAYHRVDVTQSTAVEALIQGVQQHHGKLNGIIHSAGVVRDNFIIKKTRQELHEVLAPKVSGVINLDNASKDLDLDLFVLFSSGAAVLGNLGQADYSVANAFMDAYAIYRHQMVQSNQRKGRTISIGWPLWKEGGMRVNRVDEIKMQQNIGMVAMQTSSGIEAMYKAIASGYHHVMVVDGDVARIRAQILKATSADYSTDTRAFVSDVNDGLLLEKTLRQIKILFGDVIRLNATKIDAQEPLENYGIDSIMISQLNEKLDVIFGEISKTLFYEYLTLGALAEYFVSEYPQACLIWTGLESKAASKTVTTAFTPDLGLRSDNHSNNYGNNYGNKADQYSEQAVSGNSGRFISVDPLDSKKKSPCREPIAIIGMSGRYPQANTMEEYWHNLTSGKDCVTEIPADRWSLQDFYNPDPDEAIAQAKSYSKWGGFITGFAEFDPLFFNISPREAVNMDPQERLFVQSCWAVIEDAGYTKEQLETKFDRRIGVFSGITKTGFELYGLDLLRQGERLYPHTSFSSVANRVSYLMNLQGPSMPIDTMCSSSLTAVHEACEHIYRQKCQMAIAGGVNLYLHPTSYIGLSAKQMLSIDGKCKSFGEGGNGFVPGEGVGTVLLKPLSKAIDDHDTIYALIRGTSINHGGKTNGYTVPNPVAQGEVISEAMREAGINARAVSFIEAHGTGTALGDPIEITALSQAFRKDTQETQYCAIGSVKSNLGHLEAAAGIAGIAKIVLQMQHKKLVPSLHAKTLNPNINFKKTPFVVQQALSDWTQPVVTLNGKTIEYPRIAGISSFGAGGSNAHVILEEYIPAMTVQPPMTVSEHNPAIILLSARDEKCLMAHAQQLVAAIIDRKLTDRQLPDIAYTLQVGREAMEDRLAVLVKSMAELEEKLRGFIEGNDRVEDLYLGKTKNSQQTLGVFTADEDMLVTIDAWMQKKKYSKLLELWVNGLCVNWENLYYEVKPRRISLPSYPFAKERYWLPKTEVNTQGDVLHPNSNIPVHPLLQRNTSDFEEQRYQSTFTGQEFFLADHVVNGQRVLPGVAYLEMAREAVEQAAGVLQEGAYSVVLNNVIWARPIVLENQAVHVHTVLYPEENGDISYEIYSEETTGITNAADTALCLHSQGSAQLRVAQVSPYLDLAALLAMCRKSPMSMREYYDAFKAMRIEYGAGHQGIVEMYLGSGQVLAKLKLPASVAETKARFVLHPSLMDSALQASIGLLLGAGDTESRLANAQPVIPFALQALHVFDRCSSDLWAWVRYSEGSSAQDKVQKLDIDLCDVHGQVCARLTGFSSRRLEDKTDPVAIHRPLATLMLSPDWKDQAIIRQNVIKKYTQHVVILCELDDVIPDNIENKLKGISCIRVVSGLQDVAKRYAEHASLVFNEVQRILNYKPKGQVMFQIVTTDRKKQLFLSSLCGLLKTARLENPNFLGQFIEIGETESKHIVEIVKENSRHPDDIQVRYQRGKRQVATWHEVAFFDKDKNKNIPWKQRGVYLITGGAGGLGYLLANEIVQRVNDVTIIISGRSPLNDTIQTRGKTLGAMGATIEYRQCDVAGKQGVADLISNIQQDFGCLNGIVHCAGVNRDNFIIKKTKQELHEVFAPKVAGLVNVDDASKDIPLDFLMVFSSLAGAMGNAGQADYAMANAFMDSYVAYRNELVAENSRSGKALSINWPLWKDGGMQVDAITEKMLAGRAGIVPMTTSTAMAALYQAVALGLPRLLVAEGDVEALIRSLGIGKNKRISQNEMLSELDTNADANVDENSEDAFYKALLEKIIKGEITEDQVEELIIEG